MFVNSKDSLKNTDVLAGKIHTFNIFVMFYTLTTISLYQLLTNYQRALPEVRKERFQQIFYGSAWALTRFGLILTLCISYLLLGKNLSKTQWLNIAIHHLLSLIDNETQEFGSSWSAWFWLGIPHEITVTCEMELLSSESLTGAGGSPFKVFMAVKLVLAVDRRPQLLPIWAPPQGCLSVLTAWLLASQNEQFKKPGRSCSVFMVLEVMQCHFCHLLLVTQTCPDAVWKYITQGHEHHEVRIIGAIWEVSTSLWH